MRIDIQIDCQPMVDCYRRWDSNKDLKRVQLASFIAIAIIITSLVLISEYTK